MRTCCLRPQSARDGHTAHSATRRQDVHHQLVETQRTAMPSGDGDTQVAPPPWLDKTFIADALKTADAATEEPSVQVASIQQVCGGYLSQTFRVVASYNAAAAGRQDTSLMVKIAPSSNGILRELVESGVFTKEKIAYGTFLPAVEAALRAAEPDGWQPVWPRFYHQGSEPSDFLVMEDLDASGFRKVEDGGTLNLEQCTAAVRGLARIHAASVALLEEEQYSDSRFHQALVFNEKMFASYEAIIADGFPKMLQIFDEFPWFRGYKSKLSDFGLHMVRKTLEVVTKSKVDFKVMLHGDFHKNNMMFRKNDEALQVRFFDFQGLHIGSPAEELQYFLHTSASLEVLKNNVDQLLGEYHETLVHTLRAMGLDRDADAYPLEQLQREMDHFGMVGVYITFHILPIILDTHMAEDFTDLTLDAYEQKADSFRQRYCRNEQFLSYVEYLVPLFDSKGLFDRQRE